MRARPAILSGLTLRINGVPATVFVVSPDQINFQVPFEMHGQSQAPLIVTVNRVGGSTATVNLGAYSPGLFTINQQGTGQGAIQIIDSS